MLNLLNPGIRWLLTCVLLAGIFGSSPASAFVEVRQHKMRCSAAFPCPQELEDRVNFWIDIYSRWDSQDAVAPEAISGGGGEEKLEWQKTRLNFLYQAELKYCSKLTFFIKAVRSKKSVGG